MCRHCSADPSFRGFDLRVSPLGAPVVFTARRCLPFRRLPLGGLTLPPSTSGLPLGELAFGLTASAFRHAPLRGCPRRVGSSAFRFGDGRSAGWASGSRFGVALGELAFGLTASAFRHAPLRSCPRRVGLRAHGFRFSARTASEIALGGLLLPPSVSELPFGGLAFGLTASAFRHAPLRSGHWASSFFRLPFRRLPLGGLAFGFTASAFRPAPLRSGCWASSFFRLPLRRFPSAGWPSDSRLPLFGTHRFGVAAGRIGLRASASEWPRRAGSSAGRVGLRAHCFRFSACTASEWPLGEFVLPPSVSELPFGGLAFGLTASAFRHAPLRGCRWAGWFLRLPFRSCRSASWPSGSPLSLFGTHRSASPHRRSEGRRSAPTRHLFHFKTLIPTC